MTLCVYLCIVGSGGVATFSGLNPDRGREFILVVTGHLSNGRTRTLSRGFHVGKVEQEAYTTDGEHSVALTVCTYVCYCYRYNCYLLCSLNQQWAHTTW